MLDLVSVVVPVYNVEKYLVQCVQSLLNQTYEKYEIILVDDGSTDGSGTLCDVYAHDNEKVIAYHKKNGGLSDARNYGIEHANGEFIVFVDGDDFVSERYIEDLYSLVANGKADIGICDAGHYYPNSKNVFEDSEELKLFTPAQAISCMLYQKDFLVTACAKIFPKRCFSEMRFPVGMLFEDSAIMYLLFDQVEKIAYNPSKVYAYVHRENSITTKKFSKRDCDILKICREMDEFVKRKYPELSKAMTSYYTSACLRVYLNSPNDGTFVSEQDFCRNYLKTNGTVVIKDQQARLKNKYAIVLFKICPPLLRGVYKHIDRWK